MMPVQRFAHYAERIERHDAKLGAFLNLRLTQAEAEARASQVRITRGGRLSAIDGWCIGVKANIAVAGLPHHAGIAAYRDVIAAEDSDVVARLKRAGAVILGSLNMHEGALGATTDNPAFGRTQNPWRHGFTPGGSSGGSGAAVAAGLCDAALGSDTMGSVRIPSAYCGVYGHKPTTGVVSNSGVLALSHTLDHVGPHARHVGDLVALLEAMSRKVMTSNPVDLKALRIGVWDGNGAVGLETAVANGFQAAIAKLELSGATLVPVSPPVYDYGKARRAGLLISEVEGAEIHAARLASNPAGFSDAFRGLLEWGARQPQDKCKAAYDLIAEIHDAASGLFKKVDFVIAPTAPQTAFSFDETAPANQADFTAWANFARLPATAVYTGVSKEGLPLSLQVIGSEGQDAKTLAVAQALQSLFGHAPMPEGF